MERQEQSADHGRWTRGRLLRAALGGGALVAGGTLMGVRGDGGTSVAAPSKATDAEILNLFLLLERVQEGFYREAVERGGLSGELLEYANAVGEQESEHVAFLERRLGSRARAEPQLDLPPDMFETADRFRDSAIELKEAAIGAYIGQSANLTRGTMSPIATLVAVEARQVAWIRDLAGVSPAPDAADPGRKPEQVLAALRDRRYIR